MSTFCVETLLAHKMSSRMGSPILKLTQYNVMEYIMWDYIMWEYLNYAKNICSVHVEWYLIPLKRTPNFH